MLCLSHPPSAGEDHAGDPGELGRCHCAGLAGDAAELCLPGMALGRSSALGITPDSSGGAVEVASGSCFPLGKGSGFANRAVAFLPPNREPFLGHCPHACPNIQPRAALPFRFKLICPSTDVSLQTTRSN